jgi:AraC-like DNA-binding protein
LAKRLKNRILFLCFGLFPLFSKSQDTTFIARHFFDGPVYNVLEAEGEVYAKAGKHLYKKEKDGWEELPGEYLQLFVFYKKGFFGADFIGEEQIVDPTPFKYLIPQTSLAHSTKAQIANQLFLCVGGALYEYKIDPNYSRSFADFSVRDIYMGPGPEVISTYNGIFIRDSTGLRRAKGVSYSSGDYWPTSKGKFLLSDRMYELVSADSFAPVPLEMPEVLGKVRRGAILGDSLAVMLTHAVCYFNNSSGLKPIHTGFEYCDLEAIGGQLIFSTTSGEVFGYNGSRTMLITKLKVPVFDIFTGSSLIYLATANGVYKWQKSMVGEPELITNIPDAIGVVEDFGKNIWVSSFNGLFIIPANTSIVLPFIENVEFNKGALTYYDDVVYAGSIQGLYSMQYFRAAKNFLPQQLNRLKIERQHTNVMFGITVFLIIAVSVGLLVYFRRRRREVPIIVLQKEPTAQPVVITLEAIADDIRKNNIQTVEALSVFFKTNPVQLNRMFKAFDTTPGKFLKSVKLEDAFNLMQAGTPMNEIVAKTGYSASFIRTEFKRRNIGGKGI